MKCTVNSTAYWSQHSKTTCEQSRTYDNEDKALSDSSNWIISINDATTRALVDAMCLVRLRSHPSTSVIMAIGEYFRVERARVGGRESVCSCNGVDVGHFLSVRVVY